MYCDFFGLRANPFEDRAEARLYCPTPDHEEAIAAMEYAAHYGKGLSLLLGAAGTGKTMLVRVLTQRLHATDHVVVLTVPTGQRVNVHRDVAKGFGVTLPSHPTGRKCLARLRRLLIQKLEANHRAILILDQAENLTDEDLRKIAALTELQHDDRKLIEIIFVGQPQFMKLLDSPEFSRMRQQAFGERTLRTLSAQETADYVPHRLAHCGAEDMFFDDQAIRAVFDASAGNCRLINQICNAAMVAAYGADRQHIDASVIAEVAHSAHTAVEAEPDADRDSDWPGDRNDDPPTSPVKPRPGRALRVASAPASSVQPPMRFDEGDHRESPATEPVELGVGASRERTTSLGSRPSRFAGAEGPSSVDVRAAGERMERLLRRVERSRAMQEASLAQYSTLEAQIEELASTEDRISANIDASLGHADRHFDEAAQRCQAVLGATEARVEAIEERARVAEESAARAECRLAEVNESIQRGLDVEERLNAFARELGDRVDQAQERVGLLMAGLDAGHDAYDRLESMAKQVHELAARVDERVKTERSGLEELIARAERSRSELSEEAVAAHGAEVLKAITDADRAAIESARAALAGYHEQMGELIHRGRPEVDAIGKSISARSEEVDAVVSSCTERLDRLQSASKEKAKSLNQHCDDIEARVGTTTKTVGVLESEVEQIGAEASGLSQKLSGEREAVDQRIEACRRAAQDAEHAAEKADRTQSVLVAAIEEKTAQVGSHHAAATSLLRQLADGTRAGHECQVILQRSRTEAGEVIGQLDQARTTTHAEARALAEDLREAMKFGKAQLEEAGIMQGQIETVQRSVEGSLIHVGSACERAAELEAKMARCEESLQRVDEKEGAVAALVESADRAREAIESTTGEAKHLHEALAGSIERSSNALEEVRQTNAELGSRSAAAKSLLHEVTITDERGRETLGRIEEARDRAEKAVESVEQIEQRIDTRSAEAQEVEGRLASTIDQGTVLLHDTQVTQERMEVVHRTMAAGLVDTGAAIERIKTLREEMKDCERLVEALRQAHESGDGLAEKLSHTVADGHMAHDALAQILRESNDQSEALAASTGCAAELVDRLGGVEESATATAKRIEQSTAMAGERASAVERLNRQSRETVEQADSRIKTLSTLREQVGGVIESANQKARETQAASERMERLIEDVWSLSGTSDVRAKELAARQDEAAALLKQITTATGSIEKITAPLGELVRLAEQHRGGLEKGCTSAAELVDGLKAVPGLIESANQSQTELARTVGRTDEVRRGLTELAEQADRHIAAMHDLRGASEVAERLTVQRTEAAQLLDRLENTRVECKALAGRIVEQAERIADRVDRADRLTERIDGQEIRLETGAKSIAALAKQVQAVASLLKELQEQSTRMDESITRATEKPQEVIAAAQAQAAQLESVCSAVRKVFAGLSKTTIDSMKQKDAFEAVSREAGTRLAQLKTETDRAARTLHQWVEEATRAQVRLAQTLEQVPSIAQTHQPDALARLSHIAAGPIKTMPAEEGMRMGVPPRGIEGVIAPSDAAAEVVAEEDPSDEVARMIEEAKRAPVAGRSQPVPEMARDSVPSPS